MKIKQNQSILSASLVNESMSLMM